MPSICILTTVHDPFDSRVFHKEACALARAGFAVTLLGQSAPDRIIDGVKFKPLPPRPPAHRAWRRWFRLPAVWWCARRERADAYLLHDPELTLVGLLLKLERRRVVYDVHEHVPFAILDKEWIPRALRRPAAWAYDRYERTIASQFDAIIAAYEQIAERFPNANPVIIRNLPERAQWQPATPGRTTTNGGVIAIYAGAVQADRCILELVRAANLLDPALRLEMWIVGRFAREDYAQEIAQEVARHADSRVRLIGQVPHEDMPALLAQAHMGLMSLRPQPNQERNWPIKLFEYMAAGLPILTTDNPFWLQLAGACAFPVDITQPEDIARGLTILASDAARRTEMGRAALARVAELDAWEDQAAQLVAPFSRLICTPGDLFAA